MKLLWIEPEALRLCLNKADVKLEDIIVLEEFGESLFPFHVIYSWYTNVTGNTFCELIKSK